jgi:UV DNA damage repair endonuclease
MDDMIACGATQCYWGLKKGKLARSFLYEKVGGELRLYKVSTSLLPLNTKRDNSSSNTYKSVSGQTN